MTTAATAFADNSSSQETRWHAMRKYDNPKRPAKSLRHLRRVLKPFRRREIVQMTMLAGNRRKSQNPPLIRTERAMKVLVALDFSPASQHVAAFASKVVTSLHAEVWLLHVAGPDPDFVGYEAGPQVERDLVAGKLRREHRDLQDLAGQWRDAGLNCTALLVQGPTSEKILTEGARLGVDFIVLGSHHASVLKRLFSGSTTDDVIRTARIPVLVVPSHVS